MDDSTGGVMNGLVLLVFALGGLFVLIALPGYLWESWVQFRTKRKKPAPEGAGDVRDSGEA